LTEKEQSDVQRKLNLILDAKNYVVLKDISIDIDEMEFEFSE
jgi:hypothetical protein